METGISANRGIAVPAITADAGHLKSGLIEYHIVCLIRMGIGIISRHGNIDRIIQCERCVNDSAIEVSVSAVAGVVSTACDHIGVNPVVAGPMLRPGDGYASTSRRIAASAVTSDTGHLKSGLIEYHIVCLIGMGIGIVSSHCNIDRIIQYERCVNDAAIEVSISAVAGVVSTACDQSRRGVPGGGGQRLRDLDRGALLQAAGGGLVPAHHGAGTAATSLAALARHRDVDWIKDRDGGTHQGP